MIKSALVLFLFGACLAAPPPPVPANSPEVTPITSQRSGVKADVAPITPQRSGVKGDVIPIVSQNSEVKPDGEYNFGFESGDGTVQEQKGVVKTVDKVPVIGVEGKYTYTDKDGDTHSVTYTADENGFHAEGDTLPVAPPVPEAIARALKYIEEHPYVEDKTA